MEEPQITAALLDDHYGGTGFRRWFDLVAVNGESVLSSTEPESPFAFSIQRIFGEDQIWHQISVVHLWPEDQGLCSGAEHGYFLDLGEETYEFVDAISGAPSYVYNAQDTQCESVRDYPYSYLFESGPFTLDYSESSRRANLEMPDGTIALFERDGER